MLTQIDPDGAQAAQILVDYVIRRWFQDHLQLHVLVEPVGIFPITAVSGTAAGLDIRHAVRFRPQHAQKRLGAHGAGSHFQIVGFLNDAVAVGPVLLQLEDKFLV